MSCFTDYHFLGGDTTGRKKLATRSAVDLRANFFSPFYSHTHTHTHTRIYTGYRFVCCARSHSMTTRWRIDRINFVCLSYWQVGELIIRVLLFLSLQQCGNSVQFWPGIEIRKRRWIENATGHNNEVIVGQAVTVVVYSVTLCQRWLFDTNKSGY